MTNILIGIGGTGAKCVEAFIHMCAAGIGPNDGSVWLETVDQDQSNGNLNRTSQAFSLYSDLRNDLRLNNDHQLAGGCSFLNPELGANLVGNMLSVWRPLPNAAVVQDDLDLTLMSSGYNDLFRCLFTQSELEADVGHGFVQRPNIGALGVHKEALLGGGIWPSLHTQLAGGANHRVIIVGSVFGGTGAALVPNLGQLIRTRFAHLANLQVGAVLMLPYFSYDDGNGNGAGLKPSSHVFHTYAKRALDYYDKSLDRNVFNSVFLVGWNPPFHLPFNERGGMSQTNPPLLPELYAALAAMEFFRSPNDGAEPEMHLTASDDRPGNKIEWSDLPDIGGSRDPQNALGQLIRFCVMFGQVYGPHLTPQKWKSVRGEMWFRHLVRSHALRREADGLNSTESDLGKILSASSAYCEAILQWWASVSAASNNINLFKTGVFAENNPEDANQPAVLRRKLDLGDFENLVVGDQYLGAREIYERMTEKSKKNGSEGIGVLISRLYDICGHLG